MGEVKHTPRPWMADIVEGCWIVFDAVGEYVAQIAWGDYSPNERANARLIAAAPEMLEALKLAEDVLSRSPHSTNIWPNGMHPNGGITQIRAAIAKAEGQS